MADHLAHGVSDLRLRALPAYFDELLEVVDLPLARDEIVRLRDFAPRLSELCDELATCGVPETIQHDDLHHANVFADGNCLRVLDWGDASISHPFASLVVTFRFLEERTRLAVDDAWFARLRDAHLEAVGPRPQARVRARAPRWRFGAVRCLLAASTRHRGGRTAPFRHRLRDCAAAGTRPDGRSGHSRGAGFGTTAGRIGYVCARLAPPRTPRIQSGVVSDAWRHRYASLPRCRSDASSFV